MRFYAAVLLGLLVASPAEAQSIQNAEPPSGQTLLNGLIGKDQTSPSRKSELPFKKSTPEETQEQREHYANKNPADQPITSSTVRNNTDD